METCPGDDTLQRFGMGELDDSVQAGVSEHVNSCPRCQARMGETLQKQEQILRHLRNREQALDAIDESETRTAESGSIAAEPMRKTIGPYELLETLGEGGLGTVYLAQQHEPIRRRVALKVIKAGMDTKQVVARFEAERQALAVMDHPHVAKVFDGGATPEGRPYFVMELVAGEAITVYCDRNKLSMKDRLELFIGVCEAVQHAHQKGLIHRDLKPSNVLVTVKEGKPIPKVIDFGIAKAINQRLTEKTVFTEQGLLIGTPEYMSPEQAEMGATDVDTRTDIYSLGVLLYELLTGTLPFDSKTLRKAGYGEIQRIIRDVEPPRPSTRLSGLSGEISSGPSHEGRVEDATPGKPAERMGSPALRPSKKEDTSLAAVAAQRRCDPKALVKSIRGDLDWIVMKCLEKDRTRRYETANAIALEIRRNLNNEPVLAGPPSTSYRMRKFVRRKRGSVIAASLIFLTLIGGIVGTSIGLINSNRQRAIAEEQRAKAQTQSDRADKQRANAERTADFMASMLDGVKASKALGRDTTMLREMLDAVANRIANGELKDSPEAELQLRWTIGLAYRDIAVGGANEHAERILLPTIELAEMEYGKESKQAAKSLTYVAHCLGSLGHSAEALPKYEAALEMTQRLFMGDHPGVAVSLNNVANCLNSLGRSSEGLPKFEAALEMYQRLFPGDHPYVAAGLNNIAVCLNSLGRTAEALPKFDSALEMRQRLFKGDHPDVAEGHNNVAGCLQALGRSAEALPKYEASLEMRKRLFRGDHPDVAMSLNNVAHCLESLGRSAEALPKYEAALEMYRKVLPPGHSSTLYPQIGLTGTLMALKHFAEAEPLLLDAVEQCENSAQARQILWSTVLENAVNLYDDWHAAEPGRGYDKKAAEWQAKLAEWQATTQPVTTQPRSIQR